ncbi:MAG TPA: M24 family metallopeptidase [Dehalococcoidia bacterium]|jgi:Xaa-Pro aminopeptidase|nr:M24 family metallopeptidase [Dehalococcoidia bacterium]HIK88188.1 M24 family metallopeptidase [Dehalococcoidia bacterium]
MSLNDLAPSGNPLDDAREFLQSTGTDGWLTRDYRYTNPVFEAALGKRVEHLTRPVWLWIPADGDPQLLAHEVDAGRFPADSSPIAAYGSRVQMVAGLKTLVGSATKVAMEYSPLYALPRVARVDAGTIELIRSLGPEIVSSGDVIQYSTERWTPDQLQSHFFAVSALDRIVRQTFQYVGENIRWALTEHDIAEHIRGKFDRAGLEFDDGPVVAFNEHSSDPHYDPQPGEAAVIRREGWLLIDLWARKKPESPDDRNISADITWTAKLGEPPTAKQQEVFNAVTGARDAAFDLLETRVLEGDNPKGWELDRAARDVIEKAGYGEYFVHRLGHSLGYEVHSNGVNLDDWETHDTRTVINGVGVTIEPGIYLPEFGVRSEMDVYLGEDGPEVTGKRQTEILQVETS